MNEKPSQGLQKRIDFLGRGAFAFLALFILQVSWLSARYEAEKFGIVFELGAVCTIAVFVIDCALFWATHRFIKRLEESENV